MIWTKYDSYERYYAYTVEFIRYYIINHNKSGWVLGTNLNQIHGTFKTLEAAKLAAEILYGQMGNE